MTDILETYSNTPSNKSNAPRYSLWEDNKIIPQDIDIEDLKITNTFAFYYNARVEAGKATFEEDVNKVVDKLLSTGKLRIRNTGDRNDILVPTLKEFVTIEYVIPVKKFSDVEKPTITKYNKLSYQIACHYSKNFNDKPNAVRAFLARDVHVILGEDCKSPVKFMLIWSSTGITKLDKKVDYAQLGNLPYILKMCETAGIPVFNLYLENSQKDLLMFLGLLDKTQN